VSAAAILPAKGIVPELAIAAMPDDERVWVPQAPDVWFRPLLLNTVNGGWCNLLRVRRSGILSRHRHPMLVIGYVIKGRWRYLEHEWVAEEGCFVYEPPGETHTLVVQQNRHVPPSLRGVGPWRRVRRPVRPLNALGRCST
jgi:quercetin dioxygenase-like cupin family protein